MHCPHCDEMLPDDATACPACRADVSAASPAPLAPVPDTPFDRVSALLAAGKLRANANFLSLPMVLSSPSLRNALAKEVGVREVIGRWDGINLACVGIGVVPPVPGMVVYIGEEHLPRLVEAGAVGDMCGIYYDQEGEVIKSGLEDRMIAASVDQLRAIDCLVAVACGQDKAVAVLGALRTGLISALFIDQDMAEQILAGLHATSLRKKRLEERPGK